MDIEQILAKLDPEIPPKACALLLFVLLFIHFSFLLSLLSIPNLLISDFIFFFCLLPPTPTSLQTAVMIKYTAVVFLTARALIH